MKHQKRSLLKFTLLIVLLLFIITSGNFFIAPANIKYIGVRSSSYGISPFPTKEEWKHALNIIASYFKEAQPIALWIVGVINTETNDIDLEFPSPGSSYSKITFASVDKHENYLNYFDANMIKVFLQVEPGLADVKTLIDLVLTRYGKHSCIAGFGIDIEWYRNVNNDQPGKPLTDKEVEAWEAKVKSYNNSYRLLLKHYNKTYLCPTYRGDIIFVDDSQQFSNANELITDMSDFAARFYPNPVIYQIGYRKDEYWWKRYKSPLQYLGKKLAQKTRQDCGIIWVDFTLKDLIKNY